MHYYLMKLYHSLYGLGTSLILVSMFFPVIIVAERHTHSFFGLLNQLGVLIYLLCIIITIYGAKKLDDHRNIWLMGLISFLIGATVIFAVNLEIQNLRQNNLMMLSVRRGVGYYFFNIGIIMVLISSLRISIKRNSDTDLSDSESTRPSRPEIYPMYKPVSSYSKNHQTKSTFFKTDYPTQQMSVESKANHNIRFCHECGDNVVGMFFCSSCGTKIVE
jgi:hypothetical protein